jgi:hypothetical protein
MRIRGFLLVCWIFIRLHQITIVVLYATITVVLYFVKEKYFIEYFTEAKFEEMFR